MKKFFALVIGICLGLVVFSFLPSKTDAAWAADTEKKYYTIYDSFDAEKVVFVRSDEVKEGDQYISSDNKLYEITKVDDVKMTGQATFKENVKLPVFKVKKKGTEPQKALAASKVVGIYHTHNDECYNKGDGTDSVYGKGGIHGIGKKLKENFEKLGVSVKYDETLHLPHNSGAYTRSQPTAKGLLNSGVQAIFDVHRDATPRSEYITEVDGVEMSKVRMVVGSANANSAANKEFALSIKSYADEIYPGLIKDIYIGKGNYNQQLSERAMLFEMGTNTIEKGLVEKSTVPLAKTLDVVLFGAEQASPTSLEGVELQGDLKGIANSSTNKGSNETLWVLLGSLGFVIVFTVILFFTNKEANYNIKRFFSEIFGGILGKKRPRRDI